MARALKNNLKYRRTGVVYTSENQAALKWLAKAIKNDLQELADSVFTPSGEAIMKLASYAVAGFAMGYVLGSLPR
jgi:uncharacterized membrane protein YbjE (DUF340 family)